MKKEAISRMNVQEKIDPQHFIRQVGKKPLLGRTSCSWAHDPELFAETFGPPEVDNRKRCSILFWNFLDRDGEPAFSLSAGVPTGRKGKDVQVSLVARHRWETAYLWTGDRLGDPAVGSWGCQVRRFPCLLTQSNPPG